MGIFAKRPQPEPRVQSLGEMVAFSLTNEATRSLWSRDDSELVSEALGVRIPEYIWRDGIELRGRPVPLDYPSECAISKAVCNWQKWDAECRRAEAMVCFVDAFERAASAIEGSAQDAQRLDPKGESATPNGGDAQ